MNEFCYAKLFDYGADATVYRQLSGELFVEAVWCGDQEYLRIEPAAFTLLAREAFRETNFFFRSAHLDQWAAVIDDRQATDNDRFVAAKLIENAVISAAGELPSCQDTGTANILGWKGNRVLSDGHEAEALSLGVFEAYRDNNLRYSQVAPLSSVYDDVNTGTNLPAQIDLSADKEGAGYEFLFVAKGGGSSNKTYVFPETKSLLNPVALRKFLQEKLRGLGVAACPPYHLAVVIGGTSPELNLKTVKLASAKFLDGLPTAGSKAGIAFRDLALEAEIQAMTREFGLGAQFGGKNFALDVRVIVLPRHTASVFVGIGASCSADRNIRGKITKEGVFLEALDHYPERLLPKLAQVRMATPVEIDLDQPMDAIRAGLAKLPVGTLVNLSGTLIVARDIAHARLNALLEQGKPLPEYFKTHPIYYAGPAKTPPGKASGSFGPTTAQRMDLYLETFMSQGASLITLAKGNRAASVTESCKKHGGFYLGTIGGAAALVAEQNITASELVDFPELGMEAVRSIRVEKLPAFILSDDKGHCLYS